MMSFFFHVLSVHLHQSVPRSESGLVGRGTRLHCADELSAFFLLSVQVETISALSFDQKAESGSQLVLHPSA